MLAADYVLHEVKGIKESIDLGSQLILEQYKDSRIFNIETNTTWSEIFESTEGASGGKELTDLETPPVAKLYEGYGKTLTSKRWGAGILVDETTMQKVKDGTVKVDTFLTRERDKVLRSVNNDFLVDIHLMLNSAFATTYFAAPDAAALCATHTWNTSGASTWANNATAKLSSTSVDTMLEFGGRFTDSKGVPMPQYYNTIVVKKGSANAREAKRLFAQNITPTAIGDINIYQGGEFDVIETPYITYANTNYWFGLDLSKMASPLYVGVNEMPTMREPIKETNESVRTNVTGFWKRGINMMPVNVYGSNGTT